MNKVLNSKKIQLEKLKMYLLNDLKFLDISCIKVFWSSTNDDLFDYQTSDIDIIAYTDKLKYETINYSLETIEKTGFVHMLLAWY